MKSASILASDIWTTKKANMRISSLILAAVAAVAATSHMADASAPTITNRLWTSTGNGCVVADESASLYDTRGAGIGFLSGKIGTIRLYCPIAVGTNGSSPLFFGLGLSFNHPTVNGSFASITATLRKVNDGSNAASTICATTSTATGLDQTSCTFVGAPAAMSKTTSFFIMVEVVRTSASVDPEFLAVFLFN